MTVGEERKEGLMKEGREAKRREEVNEKKMCRE